MWYKVKKIYVWTTKIRPDKYEYSYDFRGKTASQITADWWTYTNTPLFDANWMYYSSWNSVLDKTIQQIWTHNKVILECSFSILDSSLFALSCYLVSSSKTNQYWLYTDNNTSWNKMIKINGTDVYTTKSTLSIWDYNLKLLLDLSNKTYNCSSPYSTSWSLTDSQIAALRQYQNVRLLVAQPWIRFKTLNVTYE